MGFRRDVSSLKLHDIDGLRQGSLISTAFIFTAFGSEMEMKDRQG